MQAAGATAEAGWRPLIVKARPAAEHAAAVPYETVPAVAAAQELPAAEEPPRKPALPPSVVVGPARWTAASWADLPAWSGDLSEEVWPALTASCQRRTEPWVEFCKAALALGAPTRPESGLPDWRTRARTLLETELRPWRIEAQETEGESRPAGLLTGYYEPVISASRRPRRDHHVPIHRFSGLRAPGEPGGARRPAGLLGWMRDPVDLLNIQMQGSARLLFTDELDARGRPKLVRVSYAGDNGQGGDEPFGQWLVKAGLMRARDLNWKGLRDWVRAHPQRVPELLRSTPRVAYFVEHGPGDPAQGPVGAHGSTLVPGRSMAVDRRAIPLGSPVWISSLLPTEGVAGAGTARPDLQRLVMAQDTGGAIRGALRGDLFWGLGTKAEAQAMATQAPLSLWVLWPKNLPPPAAEPDAVWAGPV